MKNIRQFVFYGPGHEKNFPNSDSEWKYNLFKNYGSVSHLGIQGAPNTLFCLNHANDINAISIGGTGIYEIDLEGIGYISGLRFIWDRLIENYPGTQADPHKKLIVDIVYEEAN